MKIRAISVDRQSYKNLIIPHLKKTTKDLVKKPI